MIATTSAHAPASARFSAYHALLGDGPTAVAAVKATVFTEPRIAGLRVLPFVPGTEPPTRRFTYTVVRELASIHRATAEISLHAMAENLAAVRAKRPGAAVWAVGKANGYGHGLRHARTGFAAADGMAVVEVDNAVLLRELDWRKPILLLGGVTNRESLEIALHHHFTLAVHDESQLRMLEALHPDDAPFGVDVYLKMNSGMNRLGFAPAEYRSAYERLCALPQVNRISHFTHLANAHLGLDGDSPVPARKQLDTFAHTIGPLPGPRSTLASAGILLDLPGRSDWIRPGGALYGLPPEPHRHGLRPVMTLVSTVIAEQTLRPGDAVGYGSDFVADAPMRIGVVACGHADGYPIEARTGTPVMVHGVRTRLVGRPSMDLITVDLSGVPQARQGSRVELWGPQLPWREIVDFNALGSKTWSPRIARVPLTATA